MLSHFQSRFASTAGSPVTGSPTARKQITTKRWAVGFVIAVVPLNMRSRGVALKWILPWVRVEQGVWTPKMYENIKPAMIYHINVAVF